jgi:hypothetical protein
MTPVEAYDLALSKVEELRLSGIKVTITPSTGRGNADTVRKYSTSKNIPVDKWVHVEFRVTNLVEKEKVFEASNYLGICGIRFDFGGWKGFRDWELDWSFFYSGEVDEQWMDAKNQCEETIREQESK